MLNSQNCVVFYSPFSCSYFLITNRTTGIVTGVSKWIPHTAQTQLVDRWCSWMIQTFELRVQKLGEVWIWYIICMKWMVGKRSQTFRLIRGRDLTLFCLPLPVDVSSSSRHVEAVRRDETHKVVQPPGRDWLLIKVMFDELWIYSSKGEQMKDFN